MKDRSKQRIKDLHTAGFSPQTIKRVLSNEIGGETLKIAQIKAHIYEISIMHDAEDDELTVIPAKVNKNVYKYSETVYKDVKYLLSKGVHERKIPEYMGKAPEEIEIYLK